MDYEYYAEPRQVYVLSARSFGRYHNNRNCSRLGQSDPDEIAEGRVLAEREIQSKKMNLLGLLASSLTAITPSI